MNRNEIVNKVMTALSASTAERNFALRAVQNGSAGEFGDAVTSLIGQDEADIDLEMGDLETKARELLDSMDDGTPRRNIKTILAWPFVTAYRHKFKTIAALLLVSLSVAGYMYSDKIGNAITNNQQANTATVTKAEYDTKVQALTAAQAQVQTLTAQVQTLTTEKNTLATASTAEVEKHPAYILLKGKFDASEETVKRALEIDTLRKELVQVLATMASTRDQKVYDEQFAKFKEIDGKLAKYAPAPAVPNPTN